MYQATASFQQTCLQQMQTFNRTVGEACDEVVGKALEKPRAWRDYFAKGAGVVRRAMIYPKYYAIKDCSLAETEEASLSWLTRWTAVKRYYYPGAVAEDFYAFGPAEPPTVMRDIEILRWEYFAERERVQRPKIADWHDYSEVARECIRKQGDQAIMYGGLPSCEWQPLTSFEHCWFDNEPAMCESTLCRLFYDCDGCDDWTNRSNSEAMSWRRSDILHSFWDDMSEMTLEMRSGTSSISPSEQWGMRDGRLLASLVVTVLVIEFVDKIVRSRRSGW